ncbi:MAG TPA: MBL fold metallo-hydrolase [Aggregatilineales bacterium]|nr:MBL fold metallo-hydrolase [Aggregatilineales bacterium]
MNIVNVGYDSTNYYILADSSPRLLVDVGWPGTLPKLQHECKRMGVRPPDLKHFLITHYHPDHAGLAQELKNTGVKLIVVETQLSAIPLLANVMKPQNHYVEIDLTDNIVIQEADSRAFLARLGIQGEIIATPGHSDDSVSLILDDGSVFVGDLTHPSLAGDESNNAIRESWKQIRALGGNTIYPGHGPTWHWNNRQV